MAKDVTLTDEDGNERQLKTLHIRGDRINFVVLPDILSESPMFHRIQDFKNQKVEKVVIHNSKSRKKIVLLKARQKKLEDKINVSWNSKIILNMAHNT